MMLDGLEIAGRVHVVCLGISTELIKPPGAGEAPRVLIEASALAPKAVLERTAHTLPPRPTPSLTSPFMAIPTLPPRLDLTSARCPHFEPGCNGSSSSRDMSTTLSHIRKRDSRSRTVAL
jgi:hypothetical protein